MTLAGRRPASVWGGDLIGRIIAFRSKPRGRAMGHFCGKYRGMARGVGCSRTDPSGECNGRGGKIRANVENSPGDHALVEE